MLLAAEAVNLLNLQAQMMHHSYSCQQVGKRPQIHQPKKCCCLRASAKTSTSTMLCKNLRDLHVAWDRQVGAEQGRMASGSSC